MELLTLGTTTVERRVVGEHFSTACYLLYRTGARGCLVVDPGQGADAWVTERLRALGLSLEAILVTHGHMDHTWAVAPLSARWSAPVLLHEDDQRFLTRPEDALPAGFPATLLRGHPRTRPLLCEQPAVGTSVTIAGLTVVAHHTPGHTPGSTCFEIGTEHPVLATGDTVLGSGPGRAVPPVGDAAELARSLDDLSEVLDRCAVLLPGHGPVVPGPGRSGSRDRARGSRSRDGAL